jgi:hypothetical protein
VCVFLFRDKSTMDDENERKLWELTGAYPTEIETHERSNGDKRSRDGGGGLPKGCSISYPAATKPR